MVACWLVVSEIGEVVGGRVAASVVGVCSGVGEPGRWFLLMAVGVNGCVLAVCVACFVVGGGRWWGRGSFVNGGWY